MSQKETYILIATGGYLSDEVKVEKIIIDEKDMVEAVFANFGEYAGYILDEAAAEYIFGFSQVLVIKESQVSSLLRGLSLTQKNINYVRTYHVPRRWPAVTN